jgi:hypothetical protein
MVVVKGSDLEERRHYDDYERAATYSFLMRCLFQRHVENQAELRSVGIEQDNSSLDMLGVD